MQEKNTIWTPCLSTLNVSTIWCHNVSSSSVKSASSIAQSPVEPHTVTILLSCLEKDRHKPIPRKRTMEPNNGTLHKEQVIQLGSNVVQRCRRHDSPKLVCHISLSELWASQPIFLFHHLLCTDTQPWCGATPMGHQDSPSRTIRNPDLFGCRFCILRGKHLFQMSQPQCSVIVGDSQCYLLHILDS